jgi:hypothetical protein
MNKRFEELARQSGALPTQDCGVPQWYIDEDDLEKFAELIIRECIGIAQDRAAFDWAPPNDVNHIINEIKEHFGVE